VATPAFAQHGSYRRLGYAWLGMAAALAVHVADEALTGFLSVYNPTVLALRAKVGFFPMPTFDFRTWLTSLLIGIVGFALLAPVAFRGARWTRPILYFVAIVLGIANALGHIGGTIAGRTVESVHFARPAPGFYSSPILIAAAVYALVQLQRTRD
jgi:NO-binding membrane sensor protein with MHYT domain